MSDDEDLREAVRDLREEVDALQRRLDALEARVPEEPPDTEEAPSTTDTSSEPAARTEPSEPAEEPTEESAPETTAPAPEPSSAATDTEPADTGRDWELAVGVRWLGVVGALALVVGVVFFVRVAIERGLLGPLGRVLVGTLGGLALFAIGRTVAERQGYVRWGRIAAGGGLAVAYFSLYVAYGFESYREAIGTPLWATLLGLTLLVAGVAAVSVRDRAPLVASEAFFFGYVTAYLGLDAATLVVTPVYVLLLAGALVAIAAIRAWNWPVTGSVLGTYAVVFAWRSDLDPAAGSVAAVTVTALVVYLVGSYLLRRKTRITGRFYRGSLVALTLLNAAFAAALLETTLWGAIESVDLSGLGTAVVAVALVGFYVLTDREPGPFASLPAVRRDGAAAGLGVVLAAVALEQALASFATTVGMLALIGAAVAVAHADDAPAFRLGGHVVAFVVFWKLLVIDSRELPGFDAADPLAVLTGRPVAFLLGVATFYALAWWFQTRETTLLAAERYERLPVGAFYAVAGTILAVTLLALELSGLGVSVAWALFGFGLLGAGLLVNRLGVRALGVGVLGLAAAKVFLYDTTDLDIVARTLSFLVLGAVLLVASYLYARARGDIEFDGLRRGD